MELNSLEAEKVFFAKVERTINSCESIAQLNTSVEMYDLYKKRFGENNSINQLIKNKIEILDESIFDNSFD